MTYTITIYAIHRATGEGHEIEFVVPEAESQKDAYEKLFKVYDLTGLEIYGRWIEFATDIYVVNDKPWAAEAIAGRA